jgi:hypothetical protein
MGFARILALTDFTNAAIVEVFMMRDVVGVDYLKSGFRWDSGSKFTRDGSDRCPCMAF